MQDYLAENQWPVWVCLIISFVILFTIVCFPATHKFPFDYMLLFGFTVFFSVCVGAITGRYSLDSLRVMRLPLHHMLFALEDCCDGAAAP